MLVLTRRINESIKIGKDITVTVTGVAGGKVRIGIEAPSDVPILRQEVIERDAKIQEEIKRLTPSAEELAQFVKNNPPPQSWFDEEEECPFDLDSE